MAVVDMSELRGFQIESALFFYFESWRPQVDGSFRFLPHATGTYVSCSATPCPTAPRLCSRKSYGGVVLVSHVDVDVDVVVKTCATAVAGVAPKTHVVGHRTLRLRSPTSSPS